jgi:invasion protein IalB
MLETRKMTEQRNAEMALIKTTALAAVLLAQLAAPVLAQTTEDQPAEEGVAVDSPTGDGLSMGTEADGGIGSTYSAATFGDWEQRCVRTEGGIDPCQLYILLKDQEGNSVAELTMFSLPEGGEGPAVAGATFIAPLETLLTAGMALQVDQAKAKIYPFTTCTQIGCVARLGFTAEEVNSLRKGAAAKIVIVPFVAPEARVELAVSLKGFTDGLAAVDAANKAADAAAKAAAPADGAPAEGAPVEEAPADQ